MNRPRFPGSGTGRAAGRPQAGIAPVLVILLSLGFVSPSHAGALQPRLAHLLEAERSSGTAPSHDPGILRTPEGRWRLQLLLAPDVSRDADRSQLSAALSALGAVPHGKPWIAEPRVWEIDVPPDRLAELSGLPGVVHVGELLGPRILPDSEPGPARLSPASSSGEIESEALAEMRVPDAHGFGYRGQGIRVGIVDVGFDGYLERVGTELPALVHYRNFADAGPNTQGHGTACAEVISDIVPEAELYLAEIASSTDLQEALDWLVAEQVEVMSHSLAWFLGGGDGTGPIVDMTRAAAAEGLHWITSSGNFRRSYWQGEARNEDEDLYIDTATASGNSVRISSPTGTGDIDLILAWNRWPLSESVSFQIDVYDGTTLLGTSETDYGSDYPFAFRELTIPGAGRTAPEFRIRNDRGDPDGIDLRVFRIDGGSLDAEDRIESGSLAVPGDSPWVLSVGAYSYQSSNPEPFSSYGPSGSGLLKPDLIAADGVSTSLPRYTRFVGTSAACPHVTGAVALLLSASVEGGAFDLHWSREEVAALLRTAAEPFSGVAEAEQGWGRLRIPLVPPESARSPLRLLGSGRDGILLHLRGSSLPNAAALGIFDVLGRRVGSVPPIAAGTSTLDAHLRREAGVDYELRRESLPLGTGRYWARDPRSGASLPLVWIR